MQTYRVGIIGCGGIASQRVAKSSLFGSNPWSHASAYAEIPQCRIVAVSDIVLTNAERFVSTWNDIWSDIHVYDDHRKMLANEKLDNS